MSKLKKLIPWGIALLLILLALELRHLPRRLEGVLDDVQGDDFWNRAVVCDIGDDRGGELAEELELTLGEVFDGVWVRGPYPTKTTTVAGGWLDIHAVLPDPGHPDGGPHVNMKAFWEKTDTQGGRAYTFNIDARQWIVVRGGEKIQDLVNELYRQTGRYR